jgi:hypothetical protein
MTSLEASITSSEHDVSHDNGDDYCSICAKILLFSYVDTIVVVLLFIIAVVVDAKIISHASSM